MVFTRYVIHSHTNQAQGGPYVVALLGVLKLVTWLDTYIWLVYFSEDQRKNTIKKHVWKRLIQIYTNYSTLNSEHNWEDLQYVFNDKINKHVLLITITNSGNVRF